MACGDDGCGGSCGACAADELCASGACTALSGSALVVDAANGRHAIHPEIYGLAFASPATLTALRVPLNRWGGDGTTLFNWQTNVGNHDFSYFYENIPGDSADSFVAANTGAGAATLMTIPTIGWTPQAPAARRSIPTPAAIRRTNIRASSRSIPTTRTAATARTPAATSSPAIRRTTP